MSNKPDQLTVIETIVKGHTKMLESLTDAIQDDGNANGLMTRVALLEKHPEACAAAAASKWHSWGLRGIYGSLIIGLLFFVSKVL